MGMIVSAGHICLDITPLIPGQGFKSLSGYLIPGRLTQTDGVSISLGGSVGNTGLALKRIGADVRLLGKTGDDALGELVRRIAANEGCSGLQADPKCSTSYTIVIAPPGIDRCFLHHPGANDDFSASDIPDDVLDKATLFHFGYPTLMRQMYENDGDQLVSMYRRIHDMGIATSLDITVVDPAGPAGAANWERILERTLPFVDFFVPSYEELLYILDHQKWLSISVEDGNHEVSLDLDAIPLAEKALALGCRAVLLKCGVSGMVLVTADKRTMEKTGSRLGLDPDVWAERKFLQDSYPVETVRSTTGAGDVSIAAFLTAVTQGRKPETCVSLAAAEGACSVTAVDPLSGLMSLNALEAKIKAGWIQK